MSRASATLAGGHGRKRRRIRATPLRLLILLAVLGGGATALAFGLAARWAPARADYPVQGVALSADNGPVDWARLAGAHVDFAWLLATTGSDVRDPAFAIGWAEAGQAGLRRGAVHIYSLCRLATDQARLFLATVPRDGAALPPVVALEFSPGCTARPGRDLVLSELNVLLNAIEAHSGKAAILRISAEFETAYHISAGINRTLWLDRLYLQPRYAARDWVLWTANPWRRVTGIDGPVAWTVARP